ncbi:MAG TPA: hypothetical protein VLE22_11845, partial [Bryobacteraceae bacterium]|nr:hypothetical protein [Bryobacteraceae bacterium]
MLAMSSTHRSLTTLLLAVFTVCSAQAPDDNSGFEPIFDGKTLTSWDGEPGFWRVENGAIVGETT